MSSYDQMMQSMVQARQAQTNLKQANLAETTAQKQRRQDPNFEEINPDMYEIIDSDTVRSRRTGEVIRVQGPKGETLNSFESKLSAYEPSALDDEATAQGKRNRSKYHKRAFAKFYGMKAEDVSNEQMVELGQIQTERLRQNFEKLRGKGMLRTGVDQFGRTLARFDDYSAFGDAKEIGGNAAYFLKENYAAQIRDIESGAYSELHRPRDRSWLRALGGDQLVNITTGAGKMATGLMQSGTVALGLNTLPGVDEFFHEAREKIDTFQKTLGSAEMIWEREMAGRQDALNPELFELRKKKALKAGSSDLQANISAGIDEYTDRIARLIDNPGSVIDAVVESLPYMISIGAIGRAGLNIAAKNIGKSVLKQVTASSARKGVVEAPGMLKFRAQYMTKRYLATDAGKARLDKVAKNLGMTTVGLTEGMTASADVYDSIVNMTEKEAAQSEKYQKLRKSGLTHSEATQRLGETAYWDTLATVTLMAGAAGRATGAAAWESKLFTGLASARKSAVKGIEDATKLAAKTAAKKAKPIRSIAKAVVRPIGKGIKHVSKPGAREFVEESIQSGGGEFLSQLASFEATGKPVGPGVGGATAEGGIVGFFSGAGASAVTDSLRNIAIAATKPRKNSSGLAARTATESIRADSSNVVGGSIHQMKATQAKPDVDFKESYKGVVEAIASGDVNPFEAINQLTTLFVAHEAQGGTWTEAEQATHETFVASYRSVLADEMDTIRKMDPKDITDEHRAVILAAGAVGAIKKADMEGMPDFVRETLEIAGTINDLAHESEVILAEQVTEASTDDTRQRAINVHNEKFADAMGSKGPGLGWYVREVREVLSNKNHTERDQQFNKLIKRLDKFINSQQTKLTVAEGKDGTKPHFLGWMVKELAIMQNTRDALVQQHQALTEKPSVAPSAVKPRLKATGVAKEVTTVAEEATKDLGVQDEAVEGTAQAKPEAVPETSETTEPTVKEEQKPRLKVTGVATPVTTQAERKSNRLAAVKSLVRAMTDPDFVPSDLALTNRKDNKFLQDKLDEGLTPTEAIDALLDRIEPDKSKRKVVFDSKITEEVREKVVEFAKTLNEEKKVAAAAMPTRWQNFKDNSKAALERLRGGWITPTNRPLETEEQIEAMTAAVKKKFAEDKLPMSISDAFNRRSQVTNSLFAAIPNIMEILNDPGARNELFKALQLKPVEEVALNTFTSFYNNFEKDLKKIYRPLDLQKSWAGTQMKEHTIHFFEDNVGELDPNMVGAMAFEAMNWVTTSGQQLAYNEDADINAILGRSEEHPITDTERSILGPAGTLRNNAVREMGYAIFKHLNIEKKGNPEVNALFMDKLIVTLGGTAFSVLRYQERVDPSQVSSKWFRNAKLATPANNTDMMEGEGEKVNFVRNKQKEIETEQGTAWVDVNNDLVAAVHGGQEMFARLFGADPRVRMPKWKKPTVAPLLISRSFARISDFMRGRMLYNMQKKWTALTPVIGVLQRMNMRAYLEMSDEWMSEEDIMKEHVTKREGLRGRNRGLERDFQSMVEWNGRHGSKSFYFDQKMIRSGRVYINSNVINPQASKMHRFAFAMRDWLVQVPVNPQDKTGQKTVEDMKIAIALGFGINADKLYRAEVLKQIQEVLDSKAMSDALAVLNKEGTGQLTQEEMEVFKPFLQPAKGAPGGEGTHTMAAIIAWNTYQNAVNSNKTTVDITLPMEVDGVTNGVIATLLQLVPTSWGSSYKKMLQAGGFFFKGDGFSSYAQFVDEGNLDNYQQVSVATQNILLQMTKGLLHVKTNDKWDFRDNYILDGVLKVINSGLLPSMAELGEKVGRKWAKNPLMVVFYGSSVKSVVRAIVSSAIDDFHANLAKAAQEDNPAEAIAAAINSGHDIANVVLAANRKAGVVKKINPRSKSGEQLDYHVTAADVEAMAKRPEYGSLEELATKYTLKNDVLELFEMGIQRTYGTALSRALETQMKPIEDIRSYLNHGNKMMNILFVKDFMRRVNVLEDRRGIKLSPDDRQAIMKDMHKQGLVPAVATAASSPTDFTDNLETTNYETEYVSGDDGVGEAKYNQLLQIINRAYDDQGTRTTAKPQKAIFNRIMSKLPNTDVGVSGVVKMIHALDGVNNSAAWGEHGMLNVHDAFVGNFTKIDAVAQEMNLDFINMHAGYSLSAEILKSTTRMMSSLLVGADARLKKSEKNEVYEEFVTNLVEFGAISKKELQDSTPKQLTDEWFQSFQIEVDNNQKGRKRLFAENSISSQFAKEGGESITTDDGPTVAALHPLLTLRSTADAVLQAYRDFLTGDAEKAALNTVVAETLREAIRDNRDVNPTIRAWIDTGVNAKDLLDVLQQAYRDTPSHRTLSELHNILRPHLDTVRVTRAELRDSEGNASTNAAVYRTGTNTIIFNSLMNDPAMVATAFHEAIHAANVVKLRELEKTNPEEFNRMYDKAVAWAQDKYKGLPQNTPVYKHAFQRASLILRYRRNGPTPHPVYLISEYLAYALATPKKDAIFRLHTKDVISLMGDLLLSLQDSTGTTVLHSTGLEVDRTLFTGRTELLEADKVKGIWESLGKYEQGPVNKEHQQWLSNLIDIFIVPGLQSIEEVMQQEIAVDPNGVEHIGEIEGDTIRLQASGNKLSSNVDMTMQETAAHEYIHTILRAALGKGGDHFVRKEAQRLYDMAEKALNPDGSDFLPAQIVGDPDIAREKALARYEHIFNNPHGNQLHEFMAVALTNREFAEILTALDNKDAPLDIPYAGNILTRMWALLLIILQKLGGRSLRTNKGSVHQGVYELAKATIAINQRNRQREQDMRDGVDMSSRGTRINKAVVNAINNRILTPLQAGLASSEAKRHDPENPNIAGFLKATTYVALSSKNQAVRDEYNRFYRSVGGTKDNIAFQVLQEFTPWNKENIGTDESLGWIDMLRKSKVLLDMARQKMTENTAAYLLASLDPNNHLTEAHKEAITRVLWKSDIIALMTGDNGLTVSDLHDLLNDPKKIADLLTVQEDTLREELTAQGAPVLFSMFDKQSRSLANMMVNGIPTATNPMYNAHNIVNQYNLSIRDQIQVSNPDKLIELVDKITTLRALQLTPVGDLKLTLDMVNHEMKRTDITDDDGFTRLIGMQINFKKLAREGLFEEGPIQMRKGYVYEIYDGDINIEIVDDIPENHARMLTENMVLVGPVPKDNLDPNKVGRVMYKGLKGLAGYNKASVSLTDRQHVGTNLFATANYNSQTALRNLGKIRGDSYRTAANQFKDSFTDSGVHMVPTLNNRGEIVDYRYIMSESNKQKILKKKDMFDKVVPRMFASIGDRNATIVINKKIAELLFQEYDALKDSPSHRFVEVGRYSNTKAGKDMWNLMPTDMQKELTARFGAELFYIRDDVTNLVLGFRKMSVSNNKRWGRAAPIVRMAEKYWQETVQLMRIRIAVQTPRVVVGNAASNTAILLSESIPPSYIRRMGAEAISAMRQYQKDIKAHDVLEHQIGVDDALGKDTRRLVNKLTKLKADIEVNPVGRLVDEGLFTSIAEDLGAEDDTMRGAMINKLVDKARGIVPKAVITTIKEAYMLPGTHGYKAAVAATQYGDFVARYIKYNYDIDVNKKPKAQAIQESLDTFIYYDIPQNRELQYMNDSGFLMFTKFFMRIQHIVGRIYSQNPATALSVFGLQYAFLPAPFDENIAHYGVGHGFWQKPTLNVPGKAWDTLNLTEVPLLKWIFNPFGL